MAPTLSYCVVNTNGREYLRACSATRSSGDLGESGARGAGPRLLRLRRRSAEMVRSLGGEASDRAREARGQGGQRHPAAAVREASVLVRASPLNDLELQEEPRKR